MGCIFQRTISQRISKIGIAVLKNLTEDAILDVVQYRYGSLSLVHKIMFTENSKRNFENGLLNRF